MTMPKLGFYQGLAAPAVHAQGVQASQTCFQRHLRACWQLAYAGRSIACCRETLGTMHLDSACCEVLVL